MKKWTPLLILTVLFFTSIWGFKTFLEKQNAHREEMARENVQVFSPLVNEHATLYALYQQHPDKLLLPMSLQGSSHLRSAEADYTSQDLNSLQLEFDLMLAGSTDLGRYTIEETKTQDTLIQSINGQPVIDILTAQKSGKRLPYDHGDIRNLEPVQWDHGNGSGSGYYFQYHDGAHGTFIRQELLFIQLGYLIRLTLDLPPDKAPKDTHLLLTAQSFRPQTREK